MAKAKKATKATAAKSAGPQEMLLVASKVRAAVKGADCNFGGDAIEALNGYVYWLIQQATKRAAANGRKTVRGHDFMSM
jgi:histone H3/H4